MDSVVYSIVYVVGPKQMGYLGPMLTVMLEIKKIPITDILANECGYQIVVTKICYEGRISLILTNFIPNISALNSEHFTN